MGGAVATLRLRAGASANVLVGYLTPPLFSCIAG